MVYLGGGGNRGVELKTWSVSLIGWFWFQLDHAVINLPAAVCVSAELPRGGQTELLQHNLARMHQHHHHRLLSHLHRPVALVRGRDWHRCATGMYTNFTIKQASLHIK